MVILRDALTQQSIADHYNVILSDAGSISPTFKRAALACTDPESAKKTDNLNVFLHVKAARKMLMN